MNENGGAVDGGVGGMELVVGAGNFEAVECPAGGAETVGVREPDAEGVTIRCDGDRERTGVWRMLAVDEVARAEGEAGGDGLFVRRVDVVARADVESNGHRSVGDGERAALRVADGAPVFIG